MNNLNNNLNRDELISIVIPVYNVEKYLSRCIESVINQTYKNLDIILVDDGSTDNSGMICDEYANRDKRIRVIHKINVGLSSARNTGIEKCKGKYITFIDSDDWIELDFIEYMYEPFKTKNVDISISRLIVSYQNKNNKIINRKSKTYPQLWISDKNIAIEMLLYRKVFTNSACGKLYKKLIFDNIKFPVGRIYEDFAILYKIIDLCNCICIQEKSGYHYFVRDGSILNSKFKKKDLDLIDFSSKMINDISYKYPKCIKAAKARFLETNLELFIKLILSNNYKDYLNEFETFSHNIRKNMRYVLLNLNITYQLRLRLVVFLINPFFLIYYFKLKKYIFNY